MMEHLIIAKSKYLVIVAVYVSISRDFEIL